LSGTDNRFCLPSTVFLRSHQGDRSLSVWGALPFPIGTLCGLISVVKNFGYFGAMLWILFGVGWMWLALALLLDDILQFWREWRGYGSSIAIKRRQTRPGSKKASRNRWRPVK
jgi:hypothetical protein